jgi:MFS transporter, PPP family, 3-phenylpropionic acid transporter
VASAHAKGRRALVVAYALYFSSVGITLPFLPAYFAWLGVAPARIGVLLALGPAISLVGPSRWGRWADRTGRPDLALQAVTIGCAASFAALVPARSFGHLLLVMAAYGAFSTSMTTLLDTLAVEHLRKHGGGSFGRIRLTGSLAFTASTSLFGYFGGPGRAAVFAPLVGLVALASWVSFSIARQTLLPTRGHEPAGPPASAPTPQGAPPASARAPLLPSLAPFLVTCILHWMAITPYHGSFALHVASLGLPPDVTGACSALGVVAEVVVMAWSATLLERLGADRLLQISFAAGVVRWGLMAVVRGAPALLAVSLLHGLTFGAFYVAAVAFVSQRVPPERRASGQALFATATFGVGGVVGFALSGLGFQTLGGPGLFAAAALVDLLAFGVSVLPGRAAKP